MSNKTCTRYDMYCIEDILHIITQCPYYYNEQVTMYEEIYRKYPNVKRILDEDKINTLYYLLGLIITIYYLLLDSH